VKISSSVRFWLVLGPTALSHYACSFDRSCARVPQSLTLHLLLVAADSCAAFIFPSHSMVHRASNFLLLAFFFCSTCCDRESSCRRSEVVDPGAAHSSVAHQVRQHHFFSVSNPACRSLSLPPSPMLAADQLMVQSARGVTGLLFFDCLIRFFKKGSDFGVIFCVDRCRRKPV
jgi:hypothetical protein